MLVRIRVIESSGKRFRLWLPIVIFWPLAVVIAILFAPVAVIAAIVSVGSHSVKNALRKIWMFVIVICSLRGLLIHVEDNNDEVLINVL